MLPLMTYKATQPLFTFIRTCLAFCTIIITFIGFNMATDDFILAPIRIFIIGNFENRYSDYIFFSAYVFSTFDRPFQRYLYLLPRQDFRHSLRKFKWGLYHRLTGFDLSKNDILQCSRYSIYGAFTVLYFIVVP